MKKNLGKQIVAADAGFVYVGDCFWDGDFLRIENAKNIRVWGTTRGLGELVNGPLGQTVYDSAGTCLIPKGRVVLFLQAEGWL